MTRHHSRKTPPSHPRGLGIIHRAPEATVTIEQGSDEVMQHFDYLKLRAAKASILELNAAKAEAEAQIQDCIVQMNSEQLMMDSILAASAKPSSSDLLSLKACQLGIEAWKASITAYLGDVDACQSEIDSIWEDLPIALHKYLPEGIEEPNYPLISVDQIPVLLEALCRGGGYPLYAMLMFLPNELNDEDYVNLQYSCEDGTLGLDWILLGERNTQDKLEISTFVNNLGYTFQQYEMNEVNYLRVEGPELSELADLGMKLIREFYKLDGSGKLKLLVQGFNWNDRTEK